MRDVDNDNNLIQRFNVGEEQAFNEIFKLNQGRLMCYAEKFSLSKEESQDLVSEVFVKLFQNRRNGKSFKSVRHLENYLYLAVRHTAISQLGYSQRQSGYRKDFLTIFSNTVGEETDNHQVEAEMMQLIYQAVENLPAECKKIFKMYFLQGVSYQDIAAELGLSPQTVRNQKSSAIMLLRKQILKLSMFSVSIGTLPILLVFAGLVLYLLA